jgi:hypothetical protein
VKINQRNYDNSDAQGQQYHNGPSEEETEEGYGEAPKVQGHPSLSDVLTKIAPFSGFVATSSFRFFFPRFLLTFHIFFLVFA